VSNPATTSDLASRWRPLSDAEEIVGSTLLADAWGILKDRIGGLDDLVADDADYAAKVVRIEANAVLRVLKNPEGLVRESIDDYSSERNGTIHSGELYITDAELDELSPGSGVQGRAFSLDPFADRDWTDWS